MVPDSIVYVSATPCPAFAVPDGCSILDILRLTASGGSTAESEELPPPPPPPHETIEKKQ